MSESLKTYLKHTYKDFKTRSVNPPLVRTSTMVFKSMSDLRQVQKKKLRNPRGGHFEYGRQGTMTTFELEKILTNLENSYHTFLTPTGFGSVFLCLFSILRPGDEILIADPVYSPTRQLTDDYLNEFNLTELEYGNKDLKIKVSKSTSVNSSQNIDVKKSAKTITDVREALSGKRVTSPIIGTAYLAPEPGAKKFIEVGKKIKKGDTIMIVEAMKTMNHVPATFDGTIKEICVQDGSPVEFGQTLVILN